MLHHGDPNQHTGMLLPHWPAYNLQDDTLLELNDFPKPVEGFLEAQCAFWDDLHNDNNPYV